jgi:hypothetical protein
MNFCRNLAGTIIVAAFGAIVAAGAISLGEASTALTNGWQHGSAAAAQIFARVFYADAGCVAIALIAVVLLAENPLDAEG